MFALHCVTCHCIAILDKIALHCNTMFALHCVTQHCNAILDKTGLQYHSKQDCIVINTMLCHAYIALCDTALHCNLTWSATLAPHNVFVGQCEICSRAQCNCCHTSNAIQHNTTHSMDFSSFLQCNTMQFI